MLGMMINSLEELPSHLVGFYGAEILSLYSNNPEKYTVETDYFSGSIETSPHHYEQSSQHTRRQIINVRIGFCTKQDGDLAIAVWIPDLKNSSPDELIKWSGFAVGGNRG